MSRRDTSLPLTGRALVIVALAVFTLLSLLPLFAMLPRITGSDLATLGDTRTWSLLSRTIGLGLGVAGLGLVLGLPFGFLVARTDLPGASVLRAIGMTPLFVPTLLMAMTWTVFVDWRGAPATTWILALSYFPLVAVFTARAFERIDGRLEEAARLAGGWRAVLRSDLPLVLPAALCGACLMFTFTVNDFSVPDYVSSVGPKFNVYADELFNNWDQFKQPGLAVATALPLIALTLGVLVPVLRLRRRGAMATMASGFRQPRTIPLGAWRWPALLFVLGLLTLSVFLPLGRLLWESRGGADGSFAVMQGAFALAVENAGEDLKRSLLYAFQAATIAAFLGLVLGHAIERLRSRRAGRLLEVATLLPIAAPATLFGVGAIVTWAQPLTADLYASAAMPVMLYAGRLAPFAVLILAGAVASFDRQLEESAALAGAGPIKRLTQIVAPSLFGSIAGGWVLVFAFALRELDAGILIPEANRTAIVRVFNGVHFGRDSYVAAQALLLVFTILSPALLWTLFARKRLEILP